MNPVPHIEVLMSGSRLRINIYDDIGPRQYGMIDAQTVADKLAANPGATTIEVHINSRGGYAFDGLAIYNILKDHPARVEVVVDGVAASAASLIAMAGDTIRIPRNGLLMIHNPLVAVVGRGPELQAAVAQLEAIKAAMLEIYSARTRKSPAELSAMLDRETWFTGEQAVAEGFADSTTDAVPLDSQVVNESAVSMFKSPPPGVTSLLSLAVPGAASRQWVHPAVPAYQAGSDQWLQPITSAADAKLNTELGSYVEAGDGGQDALSSLCRQFGSVGRF